jgi:hypothetical protein
MLNVERSCLPIVPLIVILSAAKNPAMNDRRNVLAGGPDVEPDRTSSIQHSTLNI